MKIVPLPTSGYITIETLYGIFAVKTEKTYDAYEKFFKATSEYLKDREDIIHLDNQRKVHVGSTEGLTWPETFEKARKIISDAIWSLESLGEDIIAISNSQSK
jgi:aspartate/glutamate racemase